MELSGVVVLALMSFVTATPHGYGVKSGAIAKAEANAASAAFLPPIPLSIPNGAGFSGSFSKSSSSSFASSSSSASSSSFSFSGSGTNGIAGIGCTSNSCKNAGNAPSSGTINSFNGIQSSGAVASASAGAIAGSFASNSGNLSGNKCLLGKCSPNNDLQHQSQAAPSIDKYENENGCASGNCDTSINHDNMPSGYGSQNQGSTGKTGINGLNTHNKDGSNGIPPSDCSNGKCGIPPTATSSVKQDDDIFIPLTHSSNPTGSAQQKPSIYLSAPSIEPACTSHTCNEASIGSYSNDKLPSSYNVPILGTNPSVPQAPSAPACSSPNCAVTPAASNDISGPAVHLDSTEPHKGGQYQPEQTNFPTKQDAPSYSNYNFNPNKEQKKPTYAGNTPVTGGTGNPLESLDVTKPILSTSSSNDENSRDKYTGGFGGPNGSINSNIHSPSKPTAGVSQPSPKYSSQTLNPSYVGSTQHGPKNSQGYSGNDSGNTESHSTSLDLPKLSTDYLSPNQRPDEITSVGSLPSRPGTNIFSTPSYHGQTSSLTQNNHNGLHTNVGSQGYHGQYVTPKTGVSSPHPNLSPPSYSNGFGAGSNGPINGNFGHGSPHSNYDTTGKDVPVYTGGFGGPTGPIDKNVPTATQTLKPGYVTNNGEATHTSFNSGVNTGLNIGTSKPGTFISSPHPDYNAPTNSVGFTGPSGSNSGNFGLGITKPHSHINVPGKDAPTYTGGFGGPAGPVDASISVTPSKVNNLPQKTTHTTTGSDVTSDSSIHSGIHSGISKPSDTLVPPHHDITNHGIHDSITKPHVPSISNPNSEESKLPTYTGGFGAPSGLLKPNEYNLPAKLPSSGAFNPVTCTTGACDATVKSRTSNEKTSVPNKEASSAATASASAKAVAYSSGFGGPPGLLKPFDDGKQSKANHIPGPLGTNDLSESKGQHGSRSDLSGKDIEHSLSPNHPSSGQAQAGAQAAAGAQANAVAFASAGAFGVNQGTSGVGCASGCGSNVNSAGHLANSGSHGYSKAGLGEINDVTGAAAVANSVAAAGTGASAGSIARGRSFATAHALAGAAVKGGYGK